MHPIELSVIVPTFNERANVFPLYEKLKSALAGIEWEVIFVDDDSPDGTASEVANLSQKDRRVRQLHRIGRRGLSSACIEGILSSSATYVAVMDGDLQHDEAALPTMLSSLKSQAGDLAVGTRYVDGGSVGEWDEDRQRMSSFATWLSQKATSIGLSDPMSGFFMLRRSSFNERVRNLSGLGFKILLDIATTPPKNLKIVEVPFTFRDRVAGESKLDMMVLWEFLMLLLDKTVGKFVPVRFVTFAAVGGLGVIVHFAILTALFDLMSVKFIWSQTAATLMAMVFNYTLNNIITYRDRRNVGWKWWLGLASFMLVCSLGGAANVGVANYMFESQTNWALAAIAGIIVGAVWNYVVTSVYTWRK